MKPGFTSLLDAPELKWLHNAVAEVRVKRNARAKRVGLRVLPFRVLQITVPADLPLPALRALLFSHRKWIESAVRRANSTPTSIAPVPTRIELRSIGEVWTVQYSAQAKPALLESAARDLRLAAPNDEAALEVLRRWLIGKARAHLGKRLGELSSETGLGYDKMQIRLQKTRWGSCSSARTISLNAALLFLPQKFSDHVLLHELCHTVHLNHSDAFRSLLGVHDPAFRQIEHEMKSARGRFVPSWVIRPG